MERRSIQAEIGSEFWNVPTCTGQGTCKIPENTRFFLSGRSSISYIIEDIQARQQLHSVMLPSYCCETMIEPFLSHGVKVDFYPVEIDLSGRLVQLIPEHHGCDAVLIMEYFGYVSPEIWAKEYDGIVIADTTHSIFTRTSSKINADYIYGSTRKWAGFWTGGYACRIDGTFCLPEPCETDEVYIGLRKRAMEEKEAYINGRSLDREKSFLSLFGQASDMMTSKSALRGSDRDIDLIKRLDVEGMRYQRRVNAETLLKYVKDYAMFPDTQEQDCPLFVPIILPYEVRNRLRQHLIQQHIYCPVHWPVSKLHQLTVRTERIYLEELSLVCDQRYDEADMEREGQAIAHFLKREGLLADKLSAKK